MCLWNKAPCLISAVVIDSEEIVTPKKIDKWIIPSSSLLGFHLIICIQREREKYIYFFYFLKALAFFVCVKNQDDNSMHTNEI